MVFYLSSFPWYFKQYLESQTIGIVKYVFNYNNIVWVVGTYIVIGRMDFQEAVKGAIACILMVLLKS